MGKDLLGGIVDELINVLCAVIDACDGELALGLLTQLGAKVFLDLLEGGDDILQVALHHVDLSCILRLRGAGSALDILGSFDESTVLGTDAVRQVIGTVAQSIDGRGSRNSLAVDALEIGDLGLEGGDVGVDGLALVENGAALGVAGERREFWQGQRKA